MFTGIVAEVGRVARIDRRDGYQQTTIEGGSVFDDIKVGDSVSLSGACHTAVEIGRGTVTVESVAETLKRTVMGDLSVGDPVNLERSVRLADRLDGHLVQGHVDGMATVAERRSSGDNTDFTFEIGDGLGRYIAEKGSVAVDGISLTVVSVEDLGDERSRFSVTIIPHTLGATTLDRRAVGDRVNIEVDVVARYLERLHGSGTASGSGLTAEAVAAAGNWGATQDG